MTKVPFVEPEMQNICTCSSIVVVVYRFVCLVSFYVLATISIYAKENFKLLNIASTVLSIYVAYIVIGCFLSRLPHCFFRLCCSFVFWLIRTVFCFHLERKKLFFFRREENSQRLS